MCLLLCHDFVPSFCMVRVSLPHLYASQIVQVHHDLGIEHVLWLAGTGRVSKVEEFEVANVESLRLGRDADKIACVVDPAGYFWEVLERHERNVSEALCKVFDIHPTHVLASVPGWHIPMCWIPYLSRTCYIAVVALQSRLSPHVANQQYRLCRALEV